ncbi:MAG: hypothetical protein RIC14_13215 [Filomicrobium sp.]
MGQTTSSAQLASDRNETRRSAQMPPVVRNMMLAILTLLLAGGLYLYAVRGDALMADLSAIAALICG